MNIVRYGCVRRKCALFRVRVVRRLCGGNLLSGRHRPDWWWERENRTTATRRANGHVNAFAVLGRNGAVLGKGPGGRQNECCIIN